MPILPRTSQVLPNIEERIPKYMIYIIFYRRSAPFLHWAAAPLLRWKSWNRSRAHNCSRRCRPPSTRVDPYGSRRIFGKFSAKVRSFSAVLAPIFASKYAFCSIFQNLPDYLAESFEIWQNFADFATFAKFSLEFSRKFNCWFFKPIFAKNLRLQRCKSKQIL